MFIRELLKVIGQSWIHFIAVDGGPTEPSLASTIVKAGISREE